VDNLIHNKINKLRTCYKLQR